MSDMVLHDSYQGINGNEVSVFNEVIDLEDPPQLDWTVLPPELLVEIFLHVISGKEASTPLQLGRISRAWRAIVFSSCALWVDAKLRLRPPCFRRQLELLEQWMDRARRLPLNLDIALRVSNLQLLSKHEILDASEKIINAIGTKSSQISSLTLALPKECFAEISSSKTKWPTLSHLSVSTCNEDDPIRFDPWPIRVFESSTLLTTAVIHSFYLSSFSLPWSQLLHIRLEGVSPYEIRETIYLCPNLQTLDTGRVIETDESQIGETAVRLPEPILNDSLQRFTYHEAPTFEDYDYTIDAFKTLALRRLKILTIIMDDGHDGRLIFPFFPFISHSKYHLEELTIQNITLGDSDLMSSLRLLPTLTLLDLSDNTWKLQDPSLQRQTELFHLMTISPNHPTLLPNLRSFVFRKNKVFVSQEIVLKLLHSRWGPASPAGERDTSTLQSFVYKGDEEGFIGDQESAFSIWRDLGYSVSVD